MLIAAKLCCADTYFQQLFVLVCIRIMNIGCTAHASANGAFSDFCNPYYSDVGDNSTGEHT